MPKTSVKCKLRYVGRVSPGGLYVYDLCIEVCLDYGFSSARGGCVFVWILMLMDPLSWILNFFIIIFIVEVNFREGGSSQKSPLSPP